MMWIYGAQMGRFFTHYAMRALLILYLVKSLLVSDAQAFSISAFLVGFLELSSLLGGFLADRYLGIKKALKVGAVLLVLGYVSLIVPASVYAGLSLIIAGSSLFVSNISALLSLKLVAVEQKMRQESFTRMYMLQNLSAFAGTLLSAVVAEIYGYPTGFACASLGIGVSSLLLFLARHQLPERTPLFPSWIKPLGIVSVLYIGSLLGCLYATHALFFLPFVSIAAIAISITYLMKSRMLTRSQLFSLLLRLLGLTLFFMVEDQICSSLMLLTERHADRLFFGWTIPSAFIMGLNPLVIIGLGSYFARRSMPLFSPFVLTAIGFGILALLCTQVSVLPLVSIVGAVMIISTSELMIGPSTLSFTASLAPAHGQGVVMGLTGIAFSLSFQLSGLLGRLYFAQTSNSIASFAPGFAGISIALLVLGIILHRLQKNISLRPVAQ